MLFYVCIYIFVCVCDCVYVSDNLYMVCAYASLFIYLYVCTFLSVCIHTVVSMDMIWILKHECVPDIYVRLGRFPKLEIVDEDT